MDIATIRHQSASFFRSCDAALDKVVPKKITATVAMIAISAFTFAADGCMGGRLNRMGAYNGRLIDRGEGWRVFTSVFLHANAQHLAGNCWSMYNLGQVERRFGRSAIIAISASACVVKHVAQALFKSKNSWSLGLSGVVLAIVGAGVGSELRTSTPIRVFEKYAMILGPSLVIGALGAGRVNHLAHAAGLVTGLALGFIIGEQRR